MVYGLDIFENDEDLAIEILDLCIDAKKTILFSAEGLVVSKREDRDVVLLKMKERTSSSNRL